MTRTTTILLAALALIATDAVSSLAQPEILIIESIRHAPPESMWQDSDGFLWFDSGGELAEVFDGYGFTPLTQLWPELENSYLRATAIDKDGTRWLGANGLLAKTAGFYGNIEVMNHHFADSTVNEVYCFFQDAAGSMWVGSSEGLSRFDSATDTFVHYRHNPAIPTSISHDRVYDIVQNVDGRIWVATAGGVSRLEDPIIGTFSRFSLSRLSESYRETQETQTGLDSARLSVVDLMIDTSGTVWAIGVVPRLGKFGPLVWGAGYLARFEHGTQTFGEFHLGDGIRPRSIAQGPTGRYWVGTSDGLFTIDPLTDRVGRPVLKTVLGEIRERGAIDVVLDNKDILWLSDRIGTAKADLRSPEPVFETYGYNSSRPDGLTPNWIDAILANGDDTFWIGTGMPGRGQPEGGLSLFVRATGKFVHFKHDPYDEATLSSNGIYSITRTSDGELWVGTSQGLNLFDERAREAERYYLGHDTLRTRPPRWSTRTIDLNSVTGITEMPNGELWLGTDGGLVRLDRATNSLVYEPDHPGSPALDSGETSYLLGGEGLHETDVESGAWQRIWLDESDSVGTGATGWVDHLSRSRSGEIWISSFGKGLLRIDPVSKRLTQFNTANGFPTDQVTCALEDEFGFIWASSFSGLVRFDPRTLTSVSYSTVDGTLSTRFAGGSCDKAPSGELLFGGESGLTIVNPAAATTNPNPPDVSITSITIGDSLLRPGIDGRLPEPISSAGPIKLEYDENNVSIEYSGLHFSKPEHLRYEYRLPPFMNEWNAVGDRRIATFTNLDPGDYTFEVRAWNGQIRSERDASVRLTIFSPWWATWWAFLMYAVGLASVVLVGYEMRVRTLRASAEALQREIAARTRDLEDEKLKTEQQAQRLIEMDAAKNRFFANISHEFRTPLTLIIGPLQDAIEGLHDEDPTWLRRQLKSVAGNAKKLLRLVNQLLELSRLESGKLELNPQPGDLISHLRGLKDAFDPAAERQGLRLIFESNQTAIYCLFDTDKVEQIFSNLLGNALKFTPAGGNVLIEVDVLEDNGLPEVVVAIQDTGRGIAGKDLNRIFDRFEQVDGSDRREFEGTGIGLALAKDLVELHGGRISVDSRLGFGTTFTVRLPFEEAVEPGELLGVPAHLPGENSSDIFEATAQSGASTRSDVDSRSEPSEEDELILVVDDNEGVRRYLRRHLSPHYAVMEAENGATGLKAAKAHSPSLILTDVMMPVMDGYEMIERVRNEEGISDVPIVMLTARADATEAAKAIRSGADDYLAKPFDVDELKARVTGLIARRREMRDRFRSEVVVKGSDIVVSSADAAFIERIIEIVDTNLSDPNFGTDWLVDEAGLSRRQLERRLELILDESPAVLIRRLRLERASQLLRAQAGTISEIAYSVGFTSPAYFARTFRKAYGESPTEHARQAAS